jgi:hypothetical protein
MNQSGPSLLHGVLIALGGLVIVTMTLHAWLLMPGALTGFLLVGPILCTGLYELSRRHAPRASGRDSAMWSGLASRHAAAGGARRAAVRWRRRPGCWCRRCCSSCSSPCRSTLRSASCAMRWLRAGRLAVLPVAAGRRARRGAGVLADGGVGAAAAGPARQPAHALLASVRAVGDNPAPMALWAVIIMLATQRRWRR